MGLSCKKKKKIHHKVMTSSWKKTQIKPDQLWLISKPCTQLGGCPAKALCTEQSLVASLLAGLGPFLCPLCPPVLGGPWNQQKNSSEPSNEQSHMDCFPFDCLHSLMQQYLEIESSGLLMNEIFYDLSAGDQRLESPADKS